jgi:flagellar hook-length control protein FliK
VDAAAKAALEALAAAGVTQLVTENPATPTAVDELAPSLVATAAAPAAAPSTGDGTAGPAPAPAAPAVLPVAAAAPSGGTSADAGSDPGARDEGAAPDAVQTSGPAAPAATTAPVTRPEATTGATVAHPVSNQIARSVAVLRGAPDGSHTMTVVLTPDSLGPVEVSVTVHKGAVELTLRGAHEHGRAALLDAVPDLRRDLESAGLTCSRLDVDRGGRDGAWSSSQQQAGRPGEHGQGGRGSQQDRSDGGARPWHRSADRGDGPRATTRTASGLDIKV